MVYNTLELWSVILPKVIANKDELRTLPNKGTLLIGWLNSKSFIIQMIIIVYTGCNQKVYSYSINSTKQIYIVTLFSISFCRKSRSLNFVHLISLLLLNNSLDNFSLRSLICNCYAPSHEISTAISIPRRVRNYTTTTTSDASPCPAPDR